MYMENEKERKTEHDSQISQVSVMWLHPNHKKVLSNFCYPKKILIIFSKSVYNYSIYSY